MLPNLLLIDVCLRMEQPRQPWKTAANPKKMQACTFLLKHCRITHVERGLKRAEGQGRNKKPAVRSRVAERTCPPISDTKRSLRSHQTSSNSKETNREKESLRRKTWKKTQACFCCCYCCCCYFYISQKSFQHVGGIILQFFVSSHNGQKQSCQVPQSS